MARPAHHQRKDQHPLSPQRQQPDQSPSCWDAHLGPAADHHQQDQYPSSPQRQPSPPPGQALPQQFLHRALDGHLSRVAHHHEYQQQPRGRSALTSLVHPCTIAVGGRAVPADDGADATLPEKDAIVDATETADIDRAPSPTKLDAATKRIDGTRRPALDDRVEQTPLPPRAGSQLTRGCLGCSLPNPKRQVRPAGTCFSCSVNIGRAPTREWAGKTNLDMAVRVSNVFIAAGTENSSSQSIKYLASGCLQNMHSHLMNCRHCPEMIRGQLEEQLARHKLEEHLTSHKKKPVLRDLRKFIKRIWDNLQGAEHWSPPINRHDSGSQPAATSQFQVALGRHPYLRWCRVC